MKWFACISFGWMIYVVFSIAGLAQLLVDDVSWGLSICVAIVVFLAVLVAWVRLNEFYEIEHE